MQIATRRAEFDYAAIPAEHEAGARECAAWVRGTLGKLEAHTIETMTVVGVRLLEAKEAIGHGGFMAWVKSECGLSHTMALRSIALAETFGLDQIRHVANLPRTLVYSVVAPSTPPEIKADFVALASAGKPIEVRAFESRIDDARRTAKAGKKAKPETASQKRDRLSRERRAAEKWLREQEANDTRTDQNVERAYALAEMCLSKLNPEELAAFRAQYQSVGGRLEQGFEEWLHPERREGRERVRAKARSERRAAHERRWGKAA